MQGLVYPCFLQNIWPPSLICSVWTTCPYTDNIFEIWYVFSLDNQEMYRRWIYRTVWIVAVSPLTNCSKNTWMLVRACYSNYRSFILQSKRFLLENHKEEWFFQWYYGKKSFCRCRCRCRCLSTSIWTTFLKSSFSSLDAPAVLTCTFRGTFCLYPHLQRMRYMWV